MLVRTDCGVTMIAVALLIVRRGVWFITAAADSKRGF
jgi:hypothetical protein